MVVVGGSLVSVQSAPVVDGVKREREKMMVGGRSTRCRYLCILCCLLFGSATWSRLESLSFSVQSNFIRIGTW